MAAPVVTFKKIDIPRAFYSYRVRITFRISLNKCLSGKHFTYRPIMKNSYSFTELADMQL
jgi:hypothetical protein